MPADYRKSTSVSNRPKALFTKEGFAVIAKIRRQPKSNNEEEKNEGLKPKKEAFFASLTGFNNRPENTRKHGSRYQNIATLT